MSSNPNRARGEAAGKRILASNGQVDMRGSFQTMSLGSGGRGGPGSDGSREDEANKETWSWERYKARWLEILAFDSDLVEMDYAMANNYDLGRRGDSDEEITRKRTGAQPDIQKALEMSFDQRRFTMNRLDDHIGDVRGMHKINAWLESHESRCLLVEGRRTARWPRVPLYVAASLLIRETILDTGSVVLAWFATYHDRDSVQTMLKSLTGQLISNLNDNIAVVPNPRAFLRGRDIDSTETLLQLFRLLLETQLVWSPVVLAIEGVEQYQLPGPRKPELDKTLNCLSAIITADPPGISLKYPLRLLLTAHHKIIGQLGQGFPEGRHEILRLRGADRRFKLPVFWQDATEGSSSPREVSSASESGSESESAG